MDETRNVVERAGERGLEVERRHSGWWIVHGRDCQVTVERRPYWCDRGAFIAKLHPTGGTELARSIDDQDLWPRYYFDFERAVLEIEAWLTKRDQLVRAAERTS